MIIGCGGSAERWISAAVLRFLLAPSLARDLRIAAAEHGIKRAYGHLYISRWHTGYPLSRDVVVELRGRPFSGGVVEHALVGDGRKRNHGVDGERLPGLESGVSVLVGSQLLGENVWVGCRFEYFLRDFAGNLVMAVAIRDAANECGYDDLRPLASHRQHGIVEHAVVSPLCEGLFLRLREAEVSFRSPQLLCAVKLARTQQFVGAHN